MVGQVLQMKFGQIHIPLEGMKGIGARDLTDSEATEAMMELMPHWNPTKFTPKAFIDIPKAIKALPSVLGATLMIPRNEN